MHVRFLSAPTPNRLNGRIPQSRHMGRLAVLLCCLLLFPGLLAPVTAASPLTPSPEAATEAAPDDSGILVRARQWLLIQQRALHRELAERMEQLRATPDTATAAWLMLASFLYGVFHAAGPGHGKAVIATYLLTHRADLRRGLLLSALSSLLQGITAIALVFGFVTLAGRLTRDAVNHVSTLEQISFALIAALGAWLAVRALGRFRTAHRVTDQGARLRHDHDHTCHHVPPPARGESFWTLAATALSIGIRPCAGAVIVLAVAFLLELPLAGMAAVFAMSIGTGATVAVLALLAVHARRWAERTTSRRHPRWRMFGHGVTALGGAGIFTLGVMLLLAAAASPESAPLFMTPRG